MKDQMERRIKSELRQEMMREFVDVKNEVGGKVNQMNKTMVNYCSRMISFWKVNDVIL